MLYEIPALIRNFVTVVSILVGQISFINEVPITAESTQFTALLIANRILIAKRARRVLPQNLLNLHLPLIDRVE